MKALKLFLIFAFALCLIGSASAFGDVYGEWQDGSQNAQITDGESINFNFDFFSMDAPMTISITLYNSQYDLVHSFAEDLSVNTPCTSNGKPIAGTACYSGQETIDSSIYSESGNYELVMNYNDAERDSASQTLYLTISPISDTNIPVITLLGSNPAVVIRGTAYTDAGANAWDTEDGDLTDNIVVTGSVDTNVIGTYVLTYNVHDSAGNYAAPVTRTVQVVTSTIDTVRPVITLLGENPVDVLQGSVYTDAGATATDNVDGIITDNIITVNPVNTAIVGVYTITYNVRDNAGNSAVEVTRTVNVFSSSDTTAPVINVIVPEKDEEYNEDTITFKVEVNEVSEVSFSLNHEAIKTMDYQGFSGGVFTFVYEVELDDGEHEVTFYAEDAAGNIANKTVEFSVDAHKEKKTEQKGEITYVGADSFEEDLYLNQFENSKIIYLEGDDSGAVQQHLNWWQRFVAWLSRIFGFD